MDFPSLFIISFLIRSSINIGHPSCFSITFKTCASSIVFPVSSEALCYVNTICFQSLRKYAILILLCILHRFQSLFKSFPWSPLQISFWNEFFFLTVNLLSSELNSYYLLLRQVFPLLFTTSRNCCAEIFVAPSFSIVVYCCAEFLIAPNFLPLICLPHKVSCFYLFLRIVQRLLFLFAAQRGYYNLLLRA
jgi:hypothetical protein